MCQIASGVFCPRRPRASPRWRCAHGHFGEFLGAYEDRYRPEYGFLRPVIPDVVNRFLTCGDPTHGFARIRCGDCGTTRLLAFSCKGMWFCPSCHAKKVQLFGEFVRGEVTERVSHPSGAICRTGRTRAARTGLVAVVAKIPSALVVCWQQQNRVNAGESPKNSSLFWDVSEYDPLMTQAWRPEYPYHSSESGSTGRTRPERSSGRPI